MNLGDKKKGDESGRRRRGESGKKPIRHFRDLDVYQNGLQTGLRVFELSKHFPNDERFALTDQIRRSSRAVGAMVAAMGFHEYLASAHASI